MKQSITSDRRTADFKYIRNFLPKRPYLQPCRYKDAKNILIALRQWHSDGKLNPTQLLVFSIRPPEELYDVHQDPYEINNLAANPAYATKLAKMRGQLDDWMKATDDKGQQAETESMYDSDMAVYLSPAAKVTQLTSSAQRQHRIDEKVGHGRKVGAYVLHFS